MTSAIECPLCRSKNIFISSKKERCTKLDLGIAPIKYQKFEKKTFRECKCLDCGLKFDTY